MGNLLFRALLGLDDLPVRHRDMGGAEAAVPWPRHSHCLTELILFKHYSIKDHDDISSSLFISGKFLSITCCEGGGALELFTHRSCGCSIPGSVPGQAGQDLEQPGVVEGSLPMAGVRRR